jgi:predicted ATPase
MIAGVILRNFKTYRGLNYLPISNGSNYCGLIGLNGVGKSSILEALDCFFNNKQWNKNIDAQKAELSYVIPVFIVEKNFFKSNKQESFAKKYSDSIKAFIGKEIPSTIQIQRKAIWDALKAHCETLPISDKLLLPIGIDEYGCVEAGVFRDIYDSIMEIDFSENAILEPQWSEEYNNAKDTRDKAIIESLGALLNHIKDEITYIYIPKDIEPERFVKFETEEIQHLIGSNLVDKVKEQLSEDAIKEISKNLKGFIDDLSNSLPNYKFKTKSERQPNLKSKDIYDLIVHDFFSKRELFKINEGKDVPLAQLSSGEKQQAITTLIHSAIINYRKYNNKNLIIAIDEPESALHVSICYEQFQKLFEISEHCNQVLFSSHWYGFIPAIPNGSVANIIKKDDRHVVTLFDIFNYREAIKHGIQNNQGNFPIDITLKGLNDLVQSIISSVINKEIHYNWLICEGSSDKIYLEYYLKDEIRNSRLRIIPVSGLGEVEKIYKQLYLAFSDLKNDVYGKVFLLGDTDTQLHTFDTRKTNNLECKRIVKDDNLEEVRLVEMNSNITGKTDIEDALNGKAFKLVLNQFKKGEEELAFLDEMVAEEKASYYAMNLPPSNYKKLDLFFSKNKNENKVLFAKAYVEELTKGNYRIPSWILDIKGFFNKK